jgi:hypothetical protein
VLQKETNEVQDEIGADQGGKRNKINRWRSMHRCIWVAEMRIGDVHR